MSSQHKFKDHVWLKPQIKDNKLNVLVPDLWSIALIITHPIVNLKLSLPSSSPDALNGAETSDNSWLERGIGV